MQVFATRAHLEIYGLPEGWLATASPADVDGALAAASAIAAGYLAAQYTLPLHAWGEDLRRAVCHIACWDLMCRQGFDPEAAGDQAVRQRHDDAVRWLREVGAGRVEPPDLIDATPDVDEGGGWIASDPPRRW